MVHKFDPIYWNGTIFEFNEWNLAGDYLEWRRANKPIPASYFPGTLTVLNATHALPDLFHTYRSFIVLSERARAVMEDWASGDVEFIPVTIDAPRQLASRLQLANAYYFINVLGRAQRLQWLEIPVQEYAPRKDGMALCSPLPGLQWKLRERTAGEPLIWHDNPWHFENRRYSAHTDILIEDVLWSKLDAEFPEQLNALRLGGGL